MGGVKNGIQMAAQGFEIVTEVGTFNEPVFAVVNLCILLTFLFVNITYRGFFLGLLYFVLSLSLVRGRFTPTKFLSLSPAAVRATFW